MPIGISVEEQYRSLCADDTVLVVGYDTIAGMLPLDEYSIIFDTLAKNWGFVDKVDLVANNQNRQFRIPIPRGCRPNTYTATIVVEDTSAVCGDILIPIEFDVYYSSSILQSKFGNLITVLSEDSNGGYSFSDYKWYRNNELIDSVSDGYLYLDNGDVFAEGDCYHLVVKRVDDGVEMPTCEICPATTPIENMLDEDILLQTSLLDKGELVVIENIGEGVVNIYSFTGKLLKSLNVDTDYLEIAAPQESGIYILQVYNIHNSRIYKIKVK